MTPKLVTVVVPVWNDSELVPSLLAETNGQQQHVEWIIAAVEPAAGLRKLAGQLDFKLIDCPQPSRGNQLNRGAAAATGEIICFHHADSQLLPEHCKALADMAGAHEVVGGAFERGFDERHQFMRGFQYLINQLNRRVGPFFGDQSIFVRRDVYHRLGGFADIPLMEDLEFSSRLRKAGQVALLRPPLATSSRRFDRLGSMRCSLLNGLLICCYYLGVPPKQLHRWYYGARKQWNNSDLQDIQLS